MRDDEFHRELRELYRQDDRARIEHREFMAERAALASPPMSAPDDPGVIPYGEGGGPLLEGRTVEAEASDEQPFSEEQIDALEFAVKELRAERDHEIDLVIEELRAEFNAAIAESERRLVTLVERAIFPLEHAERLAHELETRMFAIERSIRMLKSGVFSIAGDDDNGNGNVLELPNWRRDVA
jgi:hypothetical protein